MRKLYEAVCALGVDRPIPSIRGGFQPLTVLADTN